MQWTEKKPNFLIVGSARAGTTSLYNYLSQHPEVYFGAKEPKFFSSQVIKFPLNGPGDEEMEKKIYIKDFQNYKKLFSKVLSEKAIGEASADTLYYHKQTIPLIKKYLGNPKIIIMLRNPIDRAFSAHSTLALAKRETLTFSQALEQENKRIKDNWEFIWHYKKTGLYFKQVKDFLENFSSGS